MGISAHPTKGDMQPVCDQLQDKLAKVSLVLQVLRISKDLTVASDHGMLGTGHLHVDVQQLAQVDGITARVACAEELARLEGREEN